MSPPARLRGILEKFESTISGNKAYEVSKKARRGVTAARMQRSSCAMIVFDDELSNSESEPFEQSSLPPMDSPKAHEKPRRQRVAFVNEDLPKKNVKSLAAFFEFHSKARSSRKASGRSIQSVPEKSSNVYRMWSPPGIGGLLSHRRAKEPDVPSSTTEHIALRTPLKSRREKTAVTTASASGHGSPQSSSAVDVDLSQYVTPSALDRSAKANQTAWDTILVSPSDRVEGSPTKTCKPSDKCSRQESSQVVCASGTRPEEIKAPISESTIRQEVYVRSQEPRTLKNVARPAECQPEYAMMGISVVSKLKTAYESKPLKEPLSSEASAEKGAAADIRLLTESPIRKRTSDEKRKPAKDEKLRCLGKAQITDGAEVCATSPNKADVIISKKNADSDDMTPLSGSLGSQKKSRSTVKGEKASSLRKEQPIDGAGYSVSSPKKTKEKETALVSVTKSSPADSNKSPKKSRCARKDTVSAETIDGAGDSFLSKKKTKKSDGSATPTREPEKEATKSSLADSPVSPTKNTCETKDPVTAQTIDGAGYLVSSPKKTKRKEGPACSTKETQKPATSSRKDAGGAQTNDGAGKSASSPKKKKERTIISETEASEITVKLSPLRPTKLSMKTKRTAKGSLSEAQTREGESSSEFSPKNAKQKGGAIILKKTSDYDPKGSTRMPKNANGEQGGTIASKDECEERGAKVLLLEALEPPRKLIGRTTDFSGGVQANHVPSPKKTMKGSTAASLKKIPENLATNAPSSISTGSPKKRQLKTMAKDQESGDPFCQAKTEIKATLPSVTPKKKKTASAPPVTKPKKKGKSKTKSAARKVADASNDGEVVQTSQSMEGDFNSSFCMTDDPMEYKPRGSASGSNFSFETDDDSTVELEFDDNYSIGEASEGGRSNTSLTGHAVHDKQEEGQWDRKTSDTPGDEAQHDTFEQKPFKLHYKVGPKCHSPGTSRTETESCGSNEGSHRQTDVTIFPFDERSRDRSSIIRR